MNNPHWTTVLCRVLTNGWPPFKFVPLPAPEIQFEHTEDGLLMAAHVRELEQMA